MIRNEYANDIYSTGFMCALFEEEGRELFDVRPAILGHLQQGGDPSPFDRIQATRLGRVCLEYLIDACENKRVDSVFVGPQEGRFEFHNMLDFPRMGDMKKQRPRMQWWMELRDIARLLAKLGPDE
jgi:6-phosphofructokinase 1